MCVLCRHSSGRGTTTEDGTNPLHGEIDGAAFAAAFAMNAFSDRGFSIEKGSPPPLVPGLETPMADTIAGDASTTATLTVGSTLNSAIDTSGDHDWVAIDLVAGESYAFSLTGVGPSGLSDPKLHLRDSDGNILTTNDDGGPGLNSLINFTATETGTYYLDAHAFSTETGNYTLGAEAVEPPSLLDSLDWGTEVTGSSLTVYFATTGETYDGETASSNWSAAEKAAAMAAFGVFADVANITFAETGNQGSATFTLVKSNLGSDTLGYFNPPGTTNAGVGVFNDSHSTWTNASLQPGGYAFVTLIHEIGHGLGLAHPHDTGGVSVVMNGVTGSFNSYGDNDLNQGIFTTMSYNDGWATGPNGLSGGNNFGWQGTLGALDIALIQEKYGVNTNHNNGSTVYQLFTGNSAGTMYQAIWDTGGDDTIAYSGSAAAVIDLRAATIAYAAGGGGFVSYVTGVIGGFTIAEGVVIENATGGSGNDTLTGNNSDNVFTGNAGNDTINGRGGSDTAIYSGAETDYNVTVNGGTTTVVDLRAGSPDGTDTLTNIETITFQGGSGGGGGGGGGNPLEGDDGDDRILGTNGDDVITGNGGSDVLRGLGGNDTIYGGDGTDNLRGDDGDDLLYGGNDRDRMVGGDGNDILRGQGGDDAMKGEAGNDRVFGDDGNDLVIGGTGNDILRGDDGNDRLFGQNDNDRMTGGAGDDTLNGGNGTDIAFFSGDFADYAVRYFANGRVRVTDQRTDRPDGSDLLIDMETLRFADGTVEIDGGAFTFTPASAEPVSLLAAAARQMPGMSWTQLSEQDGNSIGRLTGLDLADFDFDNSTVIRLSGADTADKVLTPLVSDVIPAWDGIDAIRMAGPVTRPPELSLLDGFDPWEEMPVPTCLADDAPEGL